MVIENRTIDCAEEPFRVDVCLVFLSAVAVVHGRARTVYAAMGDDSLVRLGQLISQRLGDRPRDSRSRIDFIEHVAVPLEELDLPKAQSQNLVAIGRLQESSQGLG